MAITLSLYLNESTPLDPSIRCKIYESVLRSKSQSDIKIDSPLGQDDLQDTVSERASPPEEATNKAQVVHVRRRRAPTVILGPFSPQRLEISSNSSDSSDRYSPRPLYRMTRSASVSQLITPSKSLVLKTAQTALSSPVCQSSEKFDPVAYSLPLTDPDGHSEHRSCTRSEKSWIAQEDSDHPVVIFSDASASGIASRVDTDILSRLIQDCFGPPQAIVRLPIRYKTPPPRRVRRTVPHPPNNRCQARDRCLPDETPPSPLTQMRLRRAYLPPVKTLAKRSQVYNNRSESEDTSSDISALGGGCAGCGRKRNVSNWTMIHPCGHILCWTCFSATIASVTKSHAASKCTACQGDCLSIKRHYGPVPKDNGPEHCNAVNPGASTPCCSDTIVLRIDNVAWDVTPQIVENFLPKNVLPQEHPQPIHILIDRFDGRTKDYMYIEAASDVTARKILKKRQNGMMPCGGQDGKTRAVTITRVTHHELSAELRPKGPQELTALLALCQAAVALPNRADRDLCHSPSVTRSGLAHFVKSRHGPFYAIMSILTKLRGPESPAYWDLFNLTSGAIAALARACRAPASRKRAPPPRHTEDEEMLVKLQKMYNKCFTFAETSP